MISKANFLDQTRQGKKNYYWCKKVIHAKKKIFTEILKHVEKLKGK